MKKHTARLRVLEGPEPLGYRVRTPIVGPLAMRTKARVNGTRWVPTLQKEIEKHARTPHNS